jgi:hypothetical protein
VPGWRTATDPSTESVIWPTIIDLNEPVTAMNSSTATIPMTISTRVSSVRRR